MENEIKTLHQEGGSKEVVKNFSYIIGEPEELLVNKNPCFYRVFYSVVK